MSANTLVDFTGGATQVSDGPIIGGQEPALTIPAGDYLTTTDLTSGAGDAGDAGGSINFSVEFWVRTPTIGAQQILAQGPNAHVAAPNRQWTVYLAAGGQIKFDYVDSSASPGVNHSLTGGTPLRTGVWYHVVCVRGASQKIYLNGVQDATAAATAGIWGDLVAGSADMRIGATTTTYNIDFAEFAFYRADMSAANVQRHYDAGVNRGFPASQTTKARILAILDVIDSLAPRKTNSAVQTMTERYMTGQFALDLIREATATDISGSATDPVFFSAGDGTLTFLDGAHRSSAPWNTIQDTFGDGAGELGYIDIGLDYSDSFLFNEWDVTREGSSQDPGQPQMASDATSISRYGRRPQQISGLPLSSDSLALTFASGMLAKYKNPMQRVTSITLTTVDPAVALAIFRRELSDKIRVLRTPIGGGARIQQDVWIQKIDISGSNDGTPLTVRWAVSPK